MTALVATGLRSDPRSRRAYARSRIEAKWRLVGTYRVSQTWFSVNMRAPAVLMLLITPLAKITAIVMSTTGATMSAMADTGDRLTRW